MIGSSKRQNWWNKMPYSITSTPMSSSRIKVLSPMRNLTNFVKRWFKGTMLSRLAVTTRSWKPSRTLHSMRSWSWCQSPPSITRTSPPAPAWTISSPSPTRIMSIFPRKRKLSTSQTKAALRKDTWRSTHLDSIGRIQLSSTTCSKKWWNAIQRMPSRRITQSGKDSSINSC